MLTQIHVSVEQTLVLLKIGGLLPYSMKYNKLCNVGDRLRSKQQTKKIGPPSVCSTIIVWIALVLKTTCFILFLLVNEENYVTYYSHSQFDILTSKLWDYAWTLSDIFATVSLYWHRKSMKIAFNRFFFLKKICQGQEPRLDLKTLPVTCLMIFVSGFLMFFATISFWSSLSITNYSQIVCALGGAYDSVVLLIVSTIFLESMALIQRTIISEKGDTFGELRFSQILSAEGAKDNIEKEQKHGPHSAHSVECISDLAIDDPHSNRPKKVSYLSTVNSISTSTRTDKCNQALLLTIDLQLLITGVTDRFMTAFSGALISFIGMYSVSGTASIYFFIQSASNESSRTSNSAQMVIVNILALIVYANFSSNLSKEVSSKCKLT